MDSNLIKKIIIDKIDDEIARKIDASKAEQLSFIPLCENEEKDGENDTDTSYFAVAVYNNSPKEEIREYVTSVVGLRIKFLTLPKDNFELAMSYFLNKYSNKSENPADDTENDFDLDNDFEQEVDDLDISDEDSLDLSGGDEDDDFLDGNNNSSSTDSEDVSESEENGELVMQDDTGFDDSDDFDSDFTEISDDSEGLEQNSDEQNIDDDEFDADLDLDSDFGIDNEDTEEEDDTEEDADLDGKATADVSKVKAPETKKLGEILLEEKLITENQLKIALEEAKVQNIPLGSIMVKMGFVKMKDLKEALGAQMGLKYATAEQLKALPTAISTFPEEFVKLNKVIPLNMTDNSLTVGMVNPSDKKVINEIIYQTGLKPNIVVVTHLEFENFLNTYYNTDRADTENLIDNISDDIEKDVEQGELWQQVEKEVQGAEGNVSQLANKIITMAIEKRASDIHIEPMTVGYRVRFRVDGSLSEMGQRIPQGVDSALISRFKVLSKMNIAEHRRAQDGSFTIKYKNRAQDFRINTLPVAGREKMVIRVLAPQMDAKQAKSDVIQIVGAHEDDIKKIKYLVSCPNGIVLTSGPTGSGKTTTLYAILKYLNSDDVNITTIEDPVEIKLEGINQSAVNPKAGITFANSLRAILRQDPDTILIGEIRDYETLEVAISASLTGHLVLSTIHTNSAAATITRLIEMGAKDYLVSSTVSGIVAQRLVKKLCNNCKEEYYPTEEEVRRITNDPVEIQKLTQTKIYRPKGCPNCKNTGYLGRLAVLEILVVNNEIRKMIAQRAHDVELEDYAIKNGMVTLKASCMRHILEGNTTIDEQVRILGLAGE